jgi:restriction system protein
VITSKVLYRIPRYKQWKNEAQDRYRAKKRAESAPVSIQPENEEEQEDPPTERIGRAYDAHLEDLRDSVLSELKRVSPQAFERIVVEVLLKTGYGGTRDDVLQDIGGSGDQGIDSTIREDRLGLDRIYVQAKRWTSGQKVGRPEVQAFVGALEGKRARKGIFITTAEFHQNALDYVEQIEKKVVLIDGASLAALMIEKDVGVTPQDHYIVKLLDTDFFRQY